MEHKHTENTINTDIVKDETIIKTEVDDGNDFHNDDHNEMKNLTNEELVNQVEKVIMDDSKTNDDKMKSCLDYYQFEDSPDTTAR